MRTIHADLKTAQETLASTSYIFLNINSTDYTSRLLQLEHVEEPYRETATIILRNEDRALDPGTVDLRGQVFTLGYGYNTTSGNRYCGDGAGTEGMPNLYVKSQYSISLEGKNVCVLECTGVWEKLRELKYLPTGEEPYYRVEFGGTQTIKELLTTFLAEAGITLAGAFEDDGIIDTVKPFFTTDLFSLPSLASLIYNTNGSGLIQMTKVYLRPRPSDVLKIIYPQDSDSVKETYYSDQVPFFKEYTEKRNLAIPNDIKVFWGAGDDGAWQGDFLDNLDNPGSAVDQDSIDAYTTVREIKFAPRLETQAEANSRAAAILARIKSETLAGRLVLPYHDCSVELYDRVQIQDYRGQ